jgi:hypothetical protein
MSREKKSRSAIAVLGRASKTTRGSWGPYSDENLMQLHPGLSND